MTSNPDPARITEPMWDLWESAEAVIPGVRLSGFYADKKGYHNTVKKNQSDWPTNYSIKLDLDLKHGNLDKSRAIDLTMSDTEMVKWTNRMSVSALNPNDHRLDAVREFYGTLDNKTVYGLIKDNVHGTWRLSSADSTHLWHGHTSIFSAFVNNWDLLSPLISVWVGQTLAEWDTPVAIFPSAKQGDNSEDVRYWQLKYTDIRKMYTDLPVLEVDNVYGDLTVAAFTTFAIKVGAASDYRAVKITAWLAQAFDKALIKTSMTTVPADPPFVVDPDDVTSAVNAWLEANVKGKNLDFTGTTTGKINLDD